MNKFNDDYYNGIILKLDSGFIATNPELKKAIKIFHKALKECKFSLMLPDHVRNLYELDNYKDKAESLKNVKKEQDERRKKEMIRRQNLLDRIIIPIKEDKSKWAEDLQEIDIGEETLTDIFTKRGIKSSVVQKVNKYIKESNRNEFLQFLRDNGFMLGDSIDLPEFDHHKCYINLDSYMNVCLNYYILRVQMYQRGKRNPNDLFYKSPELEYDTKEKYYFISGREFSGMEKVSDKFGNYRCSLKGYKKGLNQFIKTSAT